MYRGSEVGGRAGACDVCALRRLGELAYSILGNKLEASKGSKAISGVYLMVLGAGSHSQTEMTMTLGAANDERISHRLERIATALVARSDLVLAVRLPLEEVEDQAFALRRQV